ncbi:winged helix-turn-helix domain-containing protein [Nocardioides sp. SYSU DS0651]|uniref:winged helix-turn-helix domain-containing protein n=1 Tax=Nocardioides sp. SYSU DS0651 TaxID=3415955 RepID=UPI003F4BAF73
MPRTVLFIEDDERIRQAVALSLRAEGFEVVEASTAADGLFALAEAAVDVVLLDLMLPDRDGFDVCRDIRQRSHAPVIIVTARSDSHDVVAGLEAGADDYITKPFVGKELSARIRALLRRTSGSGDTETVVVGPVAIMPQRGVVERDGQPVPVTRTEFKLLCELAADPGRVLTREELLERVWGYDYFGDSRLVDVHVRRLRTKIEPDPAHPSVLVTVRGLGYRLLPETDPRDEASPDEVTPA